VPDGETPQRDPERDGPPASSEGGPVDGSPQSPQQDAEILAPPPVLPQDAGAEPEPAGPPSQRIGMLGRVQHAAGGGKTLWAAVAMLCVAAGVVGSILGARAVARTDANNARQQFPRTSAELGSTLKLAIQHEEDLIISASTFFAGNPKASSGEFAAWVKWAQALRRYPELDKLGLVALVRASELPAFEARTTGRTAKPLRSRTPLPGGGAPRAVPAGTRPFSCLAAVELTRSPIRRTRAGLDYCAQAPPLLSSRDSGGSIYTPVPVGGSQALAVEAPVYRGNLLPATVASRTGAFVGWLREVLVPGVALQQVLRDHPEYALRMRYKNSSSNVVFESGSPQSNAQSGTVDLRNGWTVRTFGPPAPAASVFTNGGALALLIVGSLLSVLFGVLVFLLGTGRAWTLVPEARKPPPSDLHDPLTGLANRALTLDRAEQMVARTGRQSGMLAGALFIDIDWFNDVNDKLGRLAGDQLLKIFAQRLLGVVRAGDTVGRFGGDEFVVLVESAARGVRLDSLAGRMIESLHRPVELDDFGPRFFSTASIGVAFGRYATPNDLLRDAQVALTAAKTAGKDRYTLFNANMRTIIESRAVLEDELNTALQEKQFFLLYEPVYDLTTRKVMGLEALIRWVHPKQGVLPPADFLPLAEESGQIVPIGRWALEEACAQAAAWNVAGNRVGISVMVSANQLNRDGFITDVRRALQQSGIEPSLLTLEIAETTVMRDLTATAQRLEEIRRLGVRIAIDDFGGSGYARHSDLQRMPLDVLKVDRGSLAASEDEDYRSWLLEAILVFGRDLSLTVVATGIDTDEQLATLQAMGCTLAQGSLLGKPAPADAVGGLFDSDLPTTDAPSTNL
jgi:diguanylate cyclase (GGDEF)-like protein